MSTFTVPKLIEFRAKTATGEEPGTIAGQAVPIGTVIDQGYIRHVIEPGCFAAQTKDPARIKINWTHSDERVIGHLNRWTETTAGYDYSGRVLDMPEVPDGQKALALIREGVVDEVSIRFEYLRYTEEHIKDDTGEYWLIRHTRGRVLHVAVVPFGAAGRDATIKHAAAPTGPSVSEWRRMFGLIP